ncbi:MAG: ThuA domain-containing protein [Verrucomicrobiota bacterium]
MPRLLPTLRLLALALVSAASLLAANAPKPLKVLLVTGGCCHDYDLQTKAFAEGAAKIAKIEWTVINEGGKGTTAEIPLYNNPDWAKGFDAVVHNECFANTDSPEYIRKITTAHKTGKVPAVVIHCAMHSYRAAKVDDWREFLGVTSRKHDHQSNYAVTVVAKDHPALLGFPDTWTTPKDELYIIEKLWPKAKALATSVSEKDGSVNPVIWINDYHGARVFGTTYGHSNATWHDPVFVTLVTRGLLWAAGR